ncbi:MAG: redox-sensing transcriptional repressor Rex [Treponema sp.]|nr:redox-sensing transcriptional repressor Rex [Treponema sp.]
MENIPEPSQRRLVLLGRLLAEYKEKQITSQEIERLTGWGSALARKDISLLGVKCGASNGYKVSDLRSALGIMLGTGTERKKCCIVGLGRMGQMLLESTELESSPFTIVAGFDSNVNRTEVLRSSFPLHPTTKLEQIIAEEGIRYAILSSPPSEAQETAERLAGCGIRGIVNYTPCVLHVPKGIAVENVSLLTALELLSARNASAAES